MRGLAGRTALIRRLDQFRGLKVLDPDLVEAAGEVGREFLAPVLAGVSLAGSQPSDRHLDLRPAAGAAPGLAISLGEPRRARKVTTWEPFRRIARISFSMGSVLPVDGFMPR
jgi:hypothetical protein